MNFVHSLILFVLFVAHAADAKPTVENRKCGYESCHRVDPDPSRLNVHLVPHSHDDVGWLKTVDQYYYGSASNYQYAGVQYIIGSVVDSLRANPDRRFIQVETAYFWRWWQKQSEPTKETVRQLIDSGRLEIINGAWSMNDEAAAHYHSIIDQFTWGLRIINDTLGDCGRPKIGWQIDPFGHSREMASIFAQLGYEAVFFARLDYRDSLARHRTQNMETIWQGSQSLGNKSEIFTGVLYDFYTTPKHFCWDVLCSDAPINDDPESPDYNEDKIVENFAEYALKGAGHFKTNNLLVTMGGDFTYQAAEMFYNNMDKLITGFKKFRRDINVIYSTPSCYVKAVNDAAHLRGVNFTKKTDDFFPYASGEHSYWTGYFTSRPNSKRFERQGNNLLQVAKQLTTLGYSNEEDLTLLKEVMGIMQHHDAITGTEKQHVADDYVRLLTKAVKKAESHLGDIIHKLINKKQGTDFNGPALSTCLLANISQCYITNQDEFVVVVYNPLSHKVKHFVQLPVNGTKFDVSSTDDSKLSYDVMPSINNTDTKDNNNKNSSKFNLIIPTELPPMGLSYIHVKKLPETETLSKSSSSESETDETEPKFYGNEKFGFEIDPKGLLSSVVMNGVTLPVKQEFLFYRGSNGTNYGEEKRASGAYIFRPVNGTIAQPILSTNKVKTVSIVGKHVTEVHQEFNPWVKQIIRSYPSEQILEFDWIVGPIDLLHPYEGIEVISRFTSDLKSESVFYTDSNGREMVERIRNYRETYNYTDEEPVSGNYYPVTSRITVKDTERNVEMAVLNDRAQGGSSLQDGEVELMIHRRLVNDDAFGVGEVLNDKDVVRGQHWLVVGKIVDEENNSAKLQRKFAQERLLAPWTLVGQINRTTTSTSLLLENIQSFSALKSELPENVQILTLEPWKDGSILVRFEHIMEVNEHPTLSEPVSFNLKDVFRTLDIEKCKETTLGANQWKEENQKLNWDSSNSDKITLEPMQIRTLICKLSRN